MSSYASTGKQSNWPIKVWGWCHFQQPQRVDLFVYFSSSHIISTQHFLFILSSFLVFFASSPIDRWGCECLCIHYDGLFHLCFAFLLIPPVNNCQSNTWSELFSASFVLNFRGNRPHLSINRPTAPEPSKNGHAVRIKAENLYPKWMYFNFNPL